MANRADPALGAARRRQKNGIAAANARLREDRRPCASERGGATDDAADAPGISVRASSPPAPTAAVLVALTGSAALAHNTGWKSGVRNNSATTGFASWRGTGLGVVSGWIDWKNGWSGHVQLRQRQQPPLAPVQVVQRELRPRPLSRPAATCRPVLPAATTMSRERRRRLVANGVGDAEIRLGWEASGDWFPWSAAGKPAEQWKACFTRCGQGDEVRDGQQPPHRLVHGEEGAGRRPHHLPRRRSSLITNIGISHYDDA